jgi:hypothetical protein
MYLMDNTIMANDLLEYMHNWTPPPTDNASVTWDYVRQETMSELAM